MTAGGEPYMRDKDHLTKFGADQAVQWIKANNVWQQFFEDVNKAMSNSQKIK